MKGKKIGPEGETLGRSQLGSQLGFADRVISDISCDEHALAQHSPAPPRDLPGPVE